MNHILDSIKTEAGKRLWTKMNSNYGSSVWGPVWDGIVEIEAEVEARIIKLLDQKHNSTVGDTTHNQSGNCTACETIALIKGEK